MLLHLRDSIDSSGETGARLFDLNGSRGSPYNFREGIALNGSSFFVLERSWSTDAQVLKTCSAWVECFGEHRTVLIYPPRPYLRQIIRAH